MMSAKNNVVAFDKPLKFRGNIWNLPISGWDDRWDGLNFVIDSYIKESNRTFGNRKIDFLEIGVHTAGTVRRVTDNFGDIFEYIGLDPFGELADDPYKGFFWKSDDESEAAFRFATDVFDQCHATLLRTTSDDFFKTNTSMFDIVFVDGDHRYAACLNDCENAWKALRPGGLLIIDDYGNNFHPEVEWAVRKFHEDRKGDFEKKGTLPMFFELPGMAGPVVLFFMYYKKKRNYR
jgi:hypothetical protein